MSKKKEISQAQLDQRRNAGKKKKTMTDDAIKQRQGASQLAREQSTGPVTEEGKAASSRNAWKTGASSIVSRANTWQGLGAIGKPCKSTCKDYPCTLVEDEQTQPGKDCLDRTVYVEAFDSIMAALHTGDIEHTRGMAASQLAGAITLLQEIRDQIAEAGLIVIKPFVTKEGKLVRDNDGTLAGEPMLNPLIPQYTKLLDKLGINLPELMLTPRAVAKVEDMEEAVDQLQDAFTRAAAAAQGAAPKAGPHRQPAIDAEATRLDK